MKICTDCKKEINGIANCDKWVNNLWSIVRCNDCYQNDFKSRCDIKETEYKASKVQVKEEMIAKAKWLLEDNGYTINNK